MLTREVNKFTESIKVRRELKVYLKKVSVYTRVVKPYTDAENLLTQENNYTHLGELENMYAAMHIQ